MSGAQSHEEFTRVWRAEAPHVLAFATRHVGPGMAHDVVAETFTIAWRRWSEVPAPPIAWLLVTARKVIMNRARAQRRHRALETRIALLDHVAAYAADAAETALTRRDALERLARLDEKHREALLLVAWDGLTNDEAATVLGVKPATFRRRISRARAALFTSSEPEPADPVPTGHQATDPDRRLIAHQELS